MHLRCMKLMDNLPVHCFFPRQPPSSHRHSHSQASYRFPLQRAAYSLHVFTLHLSITYGVYDLLRHGFKRYVYVDHSGRGLVSSSHTVQGHTSTGGRSGRHVHIFLPSDLVRRQWSGPPGLNGRGSTTSTPRTYQTDQAREGGGNKPGRA